MSLNLMTLSMSLLGSKVVAAGVGPHLVIRFNAFPDMVVSLLKAPPAAAKVKFIFDNTIHSFGHRVFIGVSFFGHTDGYGVFEQYRYIFVGADPS